MSKYHPLFTYLQSRGTEFVPMTFGEVERVLGFKLPKSKVYAAWWSNNPTNNVMTKEWLAAGYRTEQVDLAGQRLVFHKVARPVAGGFAEEQIPLDAQREKKKQRHPIFGALKDVTWIAPGVDLTEPADPEWADLIDDPNWGKLPQ